MALTPEVSGVGVSAPDQASVSEGRAGLFSLAVWTQPWMAVSQGALVSTVTTTGLAGTGPPYFKHKRTLWEGWDLGKDSGHYRKTTCSSHASRCRHTEAEAPGRASDGRPGSFHGALSSRPDLGQGWRGGTEGLKVCKSFGCNFSLLLMDKEEHSLRKNFS